MTKKFSIFLLLITTFPFMSVYANSSDKVNEPAPTILRINNCLTQKGSYFEGDKVNISFTLSNPSSSLIRINSIQVKIQNLKHPDGFINEVIVANDITITAKKSYEVNNSRIWTVPNNAAQDPFGVYIEYVLNDGYKEIAYQTFFHVVDKSMITTFQIQRSSYKGLDVFSLDGGMSAEYAVAKSVANLASGVSDSWKVNGHASGPNHVYATPGFLKNSVKQTVGFYNKLLGSHTPFNSVIISTGIPSIPYLSGAMKAPVLPLHFLVSANTVKEIQSILDYSNQNGYSSYSTLGYDASVPYAVAWVKLLDIPKEYIDFLIQHKVKNVILLGATAPTGGEATARKVISTQNADPDKYSAGSLFILYPQGGVAADSAALKDKVKDIDEVTQQPDFTRVADWESGIIPEQLTNFSKNIKKFTTIEDIRYITAADDGELYDLATYASLAFMHKNKKVFTVDGSSPINGVALNPYLLSDPLYENRFKYIPLVYWQGNPQQSIINKLEYVVKAAISSYFPTVKFNDLTFWINSSINFGGPEKAMALKNALLVKGLKIKENDYSLDEVWDTKDGMKAPCEVRAKDLMDFSSSQALKNWNDNLLPLLPVDLVDISHRFPQIFIKKL
jgi:hypothetical protein